MLSAWHRQKVFGAAKEVIIAAGVFLPISGSASSVGGEGLSWADFLLRSPHCPRWTLREGSEAPRRCRRWAVWGAEKGLQLWAGGLFPVYDSVRNS